MTVFNHVIFTFFFSRDEFHPADLLRPGSRRRKGGYTKLPDQVPHTAIPAA